MNRTGLSGPTYHLPLQVEAEFATGLFLINMPWQNQAHRASIRNPEDLDKRWKFRMEQHWQVMKTTEILKDRWIDLRADHCLTPEGREISPYYVMSYPDWINIVAITTDNCLLLVRQYRHAAGKFFMEIPGGGQEAADVDSEQAARRELGEETGYTSDSWHLVSTLYPNPASHTNRLHTYLALGAKCTFEQRLDHGEEGLTVHAMPIPKVLEGLQAGLIGQALHVASILLGLRAADRLK